MKKTQPLLSICIPAYNKAQSLKRLLNSIASQDSDNVEVIVVNDGSTDKTEEVVKSFQKKIFNLVYVKNAKNIGFDLNVLRVLEKASGKFCWTMGDGEYLPENSIITIKKILNNYPQCAFFLVNYSIAFSQNILQAETCIMQNKDHLFSTGQEFFKYYCKDYWNIGRLGIFCISIYAGIYNKRYLSDSLFTGLKKKYNNTFLIHLPLILEIISGNPVYFISKPLVITTPDTFNPKVITRDVYLKYLPAILRNQAKINNYSKASVIYIIWYFKIRMVILQIKAYLLKYYSYFFRDNS